MASKREIEQLVQDALEIQDHPQSKTNELSFDAALTWQLFCGRMEA
jgi:hypothetical protein